MRKGHRAAKSGASLREETGAGSDGAANALDGASGTGASLHCLGAARNEPPFAESSTLNTTDGAKDSDPVTVDESGHLQRSFGREHADGAASQRGPSPSGAPTSAPSCSSSVQAEPSDNAAGGVALMSEASMAERASAVLVIGQSEPVLSGLAPVARKATKELAQVAYTAANDHCDAHGEALKASFGNFDRVVALGWLLADALGAAPVTRAVAHAVGLKARRAALALLAAQTEKRKQASRAASKLPAEDPRRKQLTEDGEKAAAALLRDELQLPLDVPAPLASGMRKRARSDADGPARPNLQEQIVAAERAQRKAEKLVDRRAAEWHAAEDKAMVKGRVWQRVVAAQEAARAKGKKPKGLEQMDLLRDAEQNHMFAELAARDAENAWLQAHIDLREAIMDLMMLQWDDDTEDWKALAGGVVGK